MKDYKLSEIKKICDETPFCDKCELYHICYFQPWRRKDDFDEKDGEEE